jgi:hypothetical protein
MIIIYEDYNLIVLLGVDSALELLNRVMSVEVFFWSIERDLVDLGVI